MPSKKDKLTIRDETSEFLFYSTDSGTVKVEVLLGEETVWLTINRMAGLFGVDKSTISRHLKNIYESGELEQEATVAKIATVQIEGEREVTRPLEYCNLDAIISVGYRVNSPQATATNAARSRTTSHPCRPRNKNSNSPRSGRRTGRSWSLGLVEIRRLTILPYSRKCCSYENYD